MTRAFWDYLNFCQFLNAQPICQSCFLVATHNKEFSKWSGVCILVLKIRNPRDKERYCIEVNSWYHQDEKTLEMSPDSLETESFMCSLEIIAKKKTEGQYYWLGEGVDETTSPPSPK